MGFIPNDSNGGNSFSHGTTPAKIALSMHSRLHLVALFVISLTAATHRAGARAAVESPAACMPYYGYRYYAPEMGRWLSRDRIGERGGPNLSAMLANNPISRVDPLGNESYANAFGVDKNDKACTFILAIGHTGDAFTLGASFSNLLQKHGKPQTSSLWYLGCGSKVHLPTDGTWPGESPEDPGAFMGVSSQAINANPMGQPRKMEWRWPLGAHNGGFNPLGDADHNRDPNDDELVRKYEYNEAAGYARFIADSWWKLTYAASTVIAPDAWADSKYKLCCSTIRVRFICARQANTNHNAFLTMAADPGIRTFGVPVSPINRAATNSYWGAKPNAPVKVYPACGTTVTFKAK